MEKLKKFLKSIGMESHFDVMTNEAQDFDPDKLAKEAKQVMRNSLENDPDFVSKIEREQRSAVLSSKEKKIMALTGITKDEYEALPKETKFDSLLDLAVERLKASGSGDEATKTELERLRKKAQDQSTEIDGYKTKLEAKEGEVAAERMNLTIERNVEKMLGKHKLIIDGSDAAELTLRALRAQFDPEASGSDLVLYKKGTKLKATDTATEKDLSAEKFIENYVAEKKWVVANGGKPEGSNVRTSDKPEGTQRAAGAAKKALPGQEAAEAAAAARAAKKTK